MFYLWLALVALGLLLIGWAQFSLPKGTNMQPGSQPVRYIHSGAYHFLRHPMYVGNIVLITGLAGLAAGIWNALAVGTLAELLMRYWMGLEKET